MSNYPYVDIAVLDAIRRPFAAGDAMVIVSADLHHVVWADGNGLELFGLGRLDAALSGDVVLDDIQVRQILAVSPVADEERMLHLRFAQGPQTALLPVYVSLIALPDQVEAVLLRIPSGAFKNRVAGSDALEAIRNAGSHAAFVKPGVRLISEVDDIAALQIDPEDLARMMREVSGENDRLVKRQLRTAHGEMPAALARLTDEDGPHLLVVIEPDSLAINEPVETKTETAETSAEESISSAEIIEHLPVDGLGDKPTISSFWVDEPETEGEPATVESAANNAEATPDSVDAAPVRFAWKTNAAAEFVEISDGFLAAVGVQSNAVIGHSVRSLRQLIGLIDDSNVADLFDKQGTWSGRSLLWPVAGTETAMPVELAGLPVFARDRVFEGFRGFGVAYPAKAILIKPEPRDELPIDVADGNVLPFGRRPWPPKAGQVLPPLDDNEREAFAEIGARLRDEKLVRDEKPVRDENPEDETLETGNTPAILQASSTDEVFEDLPIIHAHETGKAQSVSTDNASIFSKLPLPVLVYSGEALHFANSAFLELSGYSSLAAIKDAGGLDALFGDGSEAAGDSQNNDENDSDDNNTTGMHLTTADGIDVSVNAHLQSVPWGDGKALMLAVAPRNSAPELELSANALALPGAAPEMAAAQQQIEELTAILDTATDGVVVLDAKGNIRSLNNAAEALFGYEEKEIAGQPLNTLLAIESHRAANDYMAGLVENGVASVLNDGRDMIGREREGRFIPIFVNIARLSSSEGFCAVIRDVTNWKRAEEQLTSARRDAESASTNKTEFLARMSHEIRTPLNAIIGFSDVMINERFGPLGNQRYKDYLTDIHRSGNLVLSLVNDLLDISKIEAGGQEFDFRAIELNSVVEEAVAMMQPQANRERVLIRSSYGYDLPQLVADERSIKQIVLNLVSNAIRFTDAGGQVIVSTTYEANGDLTLKVRDTGIGMDESELEDALRPYRQVGQKQDGEASGTGLGLPLARALAESNKGDFRIRSTPGEGTVIEIAFPASRVLAG